jgi:hypothetical protein
MSGDPAQAPQWVWTPPVPISASGTGGLPAPIQGSQSSLPTVPTPPSPATVAVEPASGGGPKQWSVRQTLVAVAAAVVIACLGTAAVAWGDSGSSSTQNRPGGFGGNRIGQGGTGPQGGFGRQGGAGQRGGGAQRGGFGSNGVVPNSNAGN